MFCSLHSPGSTGELGTRLATDIAAVTGPSVSGSRSSRRPFCRPGGEHHYSGGLLGIFIVSIAAVVVRQIGGVVLSMGMVAGQLLGAGLLDLLVPALGMRLEISTVVGIVLTLVAVVMAVGPSPVAKAAV